MSLLRDMLATLGLDGFIPGGSALRHDPVPGTYDAIIIGAGHNGLVCASYLGKAGRRVLVLEAQEHPGGATQTGVIGGEALGSRSAHILRNLDPGLVKDLGLSRYGLSFAAKSLPSIALDFDGAHIVMSHEPGNTAQTIRAHSERDAERYPEFFKQMLRFSGVFRDWNNQTPGRLRGMFERGLPEYLSADAKAMSSMGKSFASLSKADRAEFLRLMVSSVGDHLDRNFESDLLKGAIALDGVLGRAAGAYSPGTGWSLVQQWTGSMAGRSTGTDLPEGGMGALCEALVKSVLARSGEVRCQAPVSRILVEHGRTIGVELVTGERIFAPQVISATDPKTTLLDFLGEEYLETDLALSMKDVKQEGVTAKLNLVLDRMPRVVGFDYNKTPQARYIIAPSLSYVEAAFNPSKYRAFSPEPIMEITFPTLSDPTLVSRNDQVMSIVVQYTPFHLEGGWENHREDFIASCIGVLGNYMSDLREHIIGGELLAPVDLEEQFNLRGGHWHHGEPDLARQLMMRPAPGVGQYLGPVKGLYLCSAGSHPGGGVMGLAGKNAAKRLLRDDVEPLNTIRPAHRVDAPVRDSEQGEGENEVAQDEEAAQ
jgi:phytoene dehydrogenase-like protein